jgi:hypothetical protein
MKTRKTLGSLEIAGVCNGSPSINTSRLHQLIKANEPWNIGDKIEIVAVKEVEPKRTLIVPENVVIIQVDTYCLICIVDKNLGKSIGKFAMNGNWEVRGSSETHRGRALTESSAKQAAFECLANLGEDGFSWKTEEPDLSRYESMVAWRRYSGGEWSCCAATSRPLIHDVASVRSYYNYSKKMSNVILTLIEGRLPDGTVEMIDRWTKEEVKNGL